MVEVKVLSVTTNLPTVVSHVPVSVKAEKVWTEDEIKTLLFAKPEAVEKAIVKLYQRQTADERQSADTKHDNGRGFSQSTCRRGTIYAGWVIENPTKKWGHKLYGQALVKARKICLFHLKQLTRIANGEK
jgi:hypothetical protein